MRPRPAIPVALTIAGSDSGGGAGIQADLKTFAALGVHGTSAVTCITAQNPRKVLGIEACSPAIVRKQIEAVFHQLHPAAVKTGMLYSAAIVQAVFEALNEPERRMRKNQNQPRVPLIIDPVMVSTSGTQLLKTKGIEMLCHKLLPLATLITPNLDEAALLAGRELSAPEDLRTAAKKLYLQFGCAVLIKGGHLRGLKEAVDVFYDGNQELLLSAPFVRGIRTHGTGCTYSAAITGYLAHGYSLPRSVRAAKEFITQAIAKSQVTSGHALLNSFWRQRVERG